jgi:hypothetical protein
MAKTGDLIMTKGRRTVIELLTARPGGMVLQEVIKATGKNKKATAAKLARMKAAGLLITEGSGTQCLWGIEANRNYMRARLKVLKASAYRARLQQSRQRGRVDRSIQIKRRIVPADHRRRFAIPAVNSIWSLAA